MERIFIVNPMAGNGITGKIWPKIEESLKNSIGSFRVKFTSGPGDATILTNALEKAGLPGHDEWNDIEYKMEQKHSALN